MIMNNIFNIVQTHLKAAPWGFAKPLLFYSESFDEFIAYINKVILYQSIGTLQGHAVHSPVAGPPPVVARPTLIVSQHLTSTDIVKRIVCAQMGADIDSADLRKTDTVQRMEEVTDDLAKIPIHIAHSPSITEAEFSTLVRKAIQNHRIGIVLTDCPYSFEDCLGESYES